MQVSVTTGVSPLNTLSWGWLRKYAVPLGGTGRWDGRSNCYQGSLIGTPCRSNELLSGDTALCPLTKAAAASAGILLGAGKNNHMDSLSEGQTAKAGLPGKNFSNGTVR